MRRFRLRVNFQKLGTCRYLSHLELARAMERCVRRAGLPYVVSQGFSAHMQHAFSAALPVGTASLDEYMDLELRAYLEPSIALEALRQAELADLPILGVSYLSASEPSLQTAHKLATYEVEFHDPRQRLSSQLLTALKSSESITVLKKGRPKTYQLDEFLDRTSIKQLVASAPDAARLYLILRLSSQGSLRPEVLLEALLPKGELFSGMKVIRLSLQMEPEGTDNVTTDAPVEKRIRHHPLYSSPLPRNFG